MASHGDYLSSYQFVVVFSNVMLGFSKVSNLESKVDYDVINEGGNSYPILLPKPKRQPDIITFEKGMLLSQSLTTWNKIKPGMKIANIIIQIKDHGNTIKTLCIDEGLVISREYPLLDAMSSSVYVEKMQIAHVGLKEKFSNYKHRKTRG